MLVCVARLRGGLAPGRRAMSRVSLRSLAGLKRYARLPCRCAAAALSGLRRCGGSAGARPLRRGRGCPAGSPVAPGCSPLRLRGCCASLRPRSPLRSAAPPLRSFPAAPWVAALPSRSLGGAVAVARRAWAAAPPGPAPRRALLPAPLPRGGCAAAWPVAALPPGGRLVGVPPPRVLARCGAGVAAAAGKEKAGLAAGFPGKRRIRTPFSCR